MCDYDVRSTGRKCELDENPSWAGGVNSEGERVCIFHADKTSQQAVDQFWIRFKELIRFYETERRELFSFEGFIFPGDKELRKIKGYFPHVNFSFCKFLSQTDFSGVSFGKSVSFRYAEFAGIVVFDRSFFWGIANFTHAQFFDTSSFTFVNFYNNADFSHAVFHSNKLSHSIALISICTFHKEALFFSTVFYCYASFIYSIFLDELNIIKCVFIDIADFMEVAINKADFNQTFFNSGAILTFFPSSKFSRIMNISTNNDIIIADNKLSSNYKDLNNLAQYISGYDKFYFVIDNCKITGDLSSRCDYNYIAITNDTHVHGFLSVLFEETSKSKLILRNTVFLGEGVIKNISIVKLEGNIFSKCVVLQNCNLENTIIRDTNVDMLDFRSCIWLKRNRGLPIEMDRSLFDLDTICNEPFDNRNVKDIIQAEEIYRQIVISYERKKRLGLAGPFKVGEFEMKKLNPYTPPIEKIILWLYKYLGSYGESVWKPILGFMLFTIIVPAVYYYFDGYNLPGSEAIKNYYLGIDLQSRTIINFTFNGLDFLNSIGYSLQCAFPLRFGSMSIPNIWTAIIHIFQWITFSLFTALLIFAIRRKTQR